MKTYEEHLSLHSLIDAQRPGGTCSGTVVGCDLLAHRAEGVEWWEIRLGLWRGLWWKQPCPHRQGVMLGVCIRKGQNEHYASAAWCLSHWSRLSRALGADREALGAALVGEMEPNLGGESGGQGGVQRDPDPWHKCPPVPLWGRKTGWVTWGEEDQSSSEHTETVAG